MDPNQDCQFRIAWMRVCSFQALLINDIVIEINSIHLLICYIGFVYYHFVR